MSKLIVFLPIFGALLFGLLASTGASLAFIRNAVHKDYPGMCFYDKYEKPIAVNDSFRPTDECVRASCGDDFTLELAFCGTVVDSSGKCVLTQQAGLEYPDCCPRFDCPE